MIDALILGIGALTLGGLVWMARSLRATTATAVEVRLVRLIDLMEQRLIVVIATQSRRAKRDAIERVASGVADVQLAALTAREEVLALQRRIDILEQPQKASLP